MPGDPERVWSGTFVPLHPPRVLGQTTNGSLIRAGFKGFWGVTQGVPLSPTIFNVVMDAVLQHWASLVEDNEEGQDRCRRER